MLKRADEMECRAPAATTAAFRPGGGTELERLASAARRQLALVAAGALIGLACGIVYAVTAVPQYTASANLLLDNRRVRAVQDAYDVVEVGLEGASAVDSQVEVVKSDNVALAVIDKLQLLKDPEFDTKASPSWWTAFVSEAWSSVGLTYPATEDLVPDDAVRRRVIADELRANVEIRRVPRTLVLEIQYRSSHADKAARLANAFAEAYLFDQLEAKYDATRRASQWLQNRMAELKHQVLTTDLAVQKFKAANQLISSGGKLVSEQQLTEVNSQLVLARAEVSRAEARYDRIKAIIDGRQTEAVVTEAIGNQIIEQLRSKFVTAAKRESELSSRLGADHGSVLNLRMEMREYERLMFDELSRIAEVYRSELDIARSREKSLRESLSGLVGAAASANETLVALRELERESESYKTLYQSFLQRYQESVQQQSFPITDARVILSAQRPLKPSHPRKLRISALALLIGAGAGIGIGALREYRERAFRTGDQVRDELGLEFIGMLPSIDAAEAPRPRTRKDAAIAGGEWMLPRAPSVMRYALDQPLSGYAETLRALKIAADLTLSERPVKLIGVVSVLPGEGKSTTAKNFGSLLAHLGAKTLLIDADLRNPELSRSIAATARQGVVEAVLEGTPINELLLFEEDSSLAVLPAVVRGRVSHTSEFLASPGMKAVLRQAAQDFEYVLIDLPPLGAVVDARAIAPQLDAVVLVVEWGQTPRRLVSATIDADRLIADKCLGAVLNKVRMGDLRLYDNYGSQEYYHGKYGNYYAPAS